MFDWNSLRALAATALFSPREAWRTVMGFGWSHGAMWQILLLMTLIRVLLVGVLGRGHFYIPIGPEPALVSPLIYGAILGAGVVVTVLMLHIAGRAIGGQGSLRGAFSAVVLIEALSVLMVTAQLLTALVLLPLTPVVSFAAAVIVFICTLHYVDELHGFQSLWKAFGTMILGVIGLSAGITFLVMIFGMAGSPLPQGG
jgi:hypothetical protein